MIPFAASLLAVGGSHTGIAPVNLLEVQDTNGNEYFWADRAIVAPSELTGGAQAYLPWLLGAPRFTFNRSAAAAVGNFTIQNLSGNTLARDVEVMLRASTLEGAFFIYRCWQAHAEATWIEFHGTLTLDPASEDVATFKGTDIFASSQDDTPQEIYCETCQLQWAGPRCGSTELTECLYSFQSCQVIERPMIALNDYEKNYGESTANTPLTVINRTRRY
jgi:hypothetical protein